LLLVAVTPLRAQDTPETRAFDAAARAFSTAVYDRAEREFADFVQNFPSSPHLPEALLYQAQAAMEQKKLAAAIELLNAHLAAAGPLADQYRYWLAKAHLQGTNYAAAAESFALLIKEFPQSPRLLEASYGEALARFKLQEWHRVAELLQDPAGTFQQEAKLRANDELAVRGQLLLSEALLEEKGLPAAEQAVNRLSERDLIPEFKWRRQYLLCRIQLADQRPRQALQNTTNLLTLAAATGQRGLQAESIALQGQILEQLHEWEAAIQTYTNNLSEAVPAERRRYAFLKTIELTLAQDKIGEAAQKLEAFFAQYPQDASSDEALLTLGEIHLKQYVAANTNSASPLTNALLATTNHLLAALGQFDKLVTTMTNSALLGRAQLDRGWCLWLDDKVRESLGAFKLAAERLPFSEDQAVARFKLADAQFQQKDLTNALQNYRSVVDDFTSLARVQNTLAGPALYQLLRVALELRDLNEAADAMRRLLDLDPGSVLADKGLLLVGQNLTLAGRPEEARTLLTNFIQRWPTSPLLPEVELALARSYSQQQSWDPAIAKYEDWLARFTTNSLRPRATFNLAWANYQAGRSTNALSLFTNFAAEFPDSELAPLAQHWVGSFYYEQKDFVNAEKNFQGIFERTNWPPTPLSYQARMMAGRAAFARQGWKDAAEHFTKLVNDNACPTNLAAEAWFALGDTLTQQDADPAKPLQKFEDAKTAYSRIPQLCPSSPLVARAWGKVGDCYLQLASQEGKYYDNAIESYQKVLSPELKADVAARCLAEIGWAAVLERQAHLKKSPEDVALLKAALDHSLNVVYGKNLGDGEGLDPTCLKEAGLSAVRLAEELKQWQVVERICERLAGALPPLRPALERRAEKAREHLPAEAVF
jgi:TolA-binding protein